MAGRVDAKTASASGPGARVRTESAGIATGEAPCMMRAADHDGTARDTGYPRRSRPCHSRGRYGRMCRWGICGDAWDRRAAARHVSLVLCGSGTPGSAGHRFIAEPSEPDTSTEAHVQ
jgi:hypothetical protein